MYNSFPETANLLIMASIDVQARPILSNCQEKKPNTRARADVDEP